MLDAVYVALGGVLTVAAIAAGTWKAWTVWRDIERPMPTRLGGLAGLLTVAAVILVATFATLRPSWPLAAAGPVLILSIGLVLAAGWALKERDRRFQARLTGRRWLLPPAFIALAWIAGTVLVGTALLATAERIVPGRWCTTGHDCHHAGIAVGAAILTLAVVGVIGGTVHTLVQYWRRRRHDRAPRRRAVSS